MLTSEKILTDKLYVQYVRVTIELKSFFYSGTLSTLWKLNDITFMIWDPRQCFHYDFENNLNNKSKKEIKIKDVSAICQKKIVCRNRNQGSTYIICFLLDTRDLHFVQHFTKLNLYLKKKSSYLRALPIHPGKITLCAWRLPLYLIKLPIYCDKSYIYHQRTTSSYIGKKYHYLLKMWLKVSSVSRKK